MNPLCVDIDAPVGEAVDPFQTFLRIWGQKADDIIETFSPILGEMPRKRFYKLRVSVLNLVKRLKKINAKLRVSEKELRKSPWEFALMVRAGCGEYAWEGALAELSGALANLRRIIEYVQGLCKSPHITSDDIMEEAMIVFSTVIASGRRDMRRVWKRRPVVILDEGNSVVCGTLWYRLAQFCIFSLSCSNS